MTLMSRACNDLHRYQTVEWSAKVASIHSQLLPRSTHFLLPNLPDIISPEQEQLYYDMNQPKTRIQTIAACLHNHDSLLKCVAASSANNAKNVDKFLIVGGNNKGSGTMSTVEAARIIQDVTDTELWSVANPNDKMSPDRVLEKLEAGIRGIITQPLLGSHALEVLESYPRYQGTVYIAGVALPRSTKGLLLWLELLGQPDLIEDPLFRHHLEHFSSSSQKSSLSWAEDEVGDLARAATIDGFHYMPMNNIDDLLSLFRNQQL